MTTKCNCSLEDGIHEWDCAIEVEKRRNKQASQMLDKMAPWFGLEKQKVGNHGKWRWSEKSRLTKRALDHGDSSAKKDKSIPENNTATEEDTTPAHGK